MKRRWLVILRSKIHPMCACQNPRTSAAGDVPKSHGECGSPSASAWAWCRRWSATQCRIGPCTARLPATASAIRSPRRARNARWVKCRWKPTVTPSIETT